jgi:DNA-binding beta-propeller fold protein YncE
MIRFPIRALTFALSLAALSLTAYAGDPTPNHLAASRPAAYHVVKTYKIPGDGRWDYMIVDPDSHHLFVPRSSHVQVINTADGSILGDIPNTNGVHGVALVPDLKRAFASDGKDNPVTIFDTDSFKTIGTVPTGDGPDGIIYDAFSKRVFCMNGREGSVSLIPADADPAKPGVVTIPLNGKPEFAASDGAGHVYINLEDKNEIAVVDSKEMKVVDHWPLTGGDEPTGMAVDPQTHRIFVGCHNKLMFVVNADTGKIVTTFPIGPDVDACAFDPDSKLAFASCGDAILSVIHEDDADHFTALPNVATEKGSRSLALDTKTHAIFMPTADFAPTTERQRRAPMIDGSFRIIVLTP